MHNINIKNKYCYHLIMVAAATIYNRRIEVVVITIMVKKTIFFRLGSAQVMHDNLRISIQYQRYSL